MALTECIECGGLVSDAASSCPHCGHPEPTAFVGQTSTQEEPDSDSRATVEVQNRPTWPVFLWTVGFWLGGTLVNAAVVAAGIVITNQWGFGSAYESSWFRVLLPYALAAVGLFIGLARRQRGERNPYKALALASAAVVVVGVGILLVSAYAATETVEDAVASANETQATTPPVVQASTTSTTERFYPIGSGFWSRITTELWNPNRRAITSAFDADNSAEARVVCTLAKPDASTMADEAMTYKPTDLRDLLAGLLTEIETFYEHCAAGDWEAVAESEDLVHAFYDLIEKEIFGSGDGSPDS